MLLTERQLLRVSLAIAVAGILTLFALAAILQPPLLSVSQATAASGQAKITVRGFVNSVTVTSSMAAIELAELKTLDAVSFDTKSVEKLGLTRFEEVEAVGELGKYKGTQSFVIAKLRVLNASGCGCRD